jgi:hypothetical protein
MPMKLYHISTGVDELDKTFIPRIPGYNGEDRSTPRICFAKTVNGCVMALPPHSRDAISHRGKLFTLYTLDTDIHTDIDIVSNRRVSDLVFDANITGEVWCLTPVTLRGVICEVTSMNGYPMLNPRNIDVDELLYLAEEITKTDFSNDPRIDKTSSDACYNSLMKITDTEEYDYAWDDIFYAIAAAEPATQMWNIDMTYKERRDYDVNKNRVIGDLLFT